MTNPNSHADRNLPMGVHLVGSIPLGTTENVFRTVVKIVGDRVRRIPDGEVGDRRHWMRWQEPIVASSP